MASDIATEKDDLKQLLKATVLETLQEQREMFYDIFTEVLEDFALGMAIREGQQTKLVDRQDVEELLRRKS